MKVLLVCNGFPPSGQWGTEYYAYGLARGLVQGGHEVGVFYPVRDGQRARFDLHKEQRSGLVVHELANAGDPRKLFRDSYRCEGVEAAFAQLLEEERPDVVHFLHLFWGLSVDLPRIAQEAGARTVVTPTDLGLICHRGQLFDHRSQACTGPSKSEKCARCVREPGSWDLPPVQRSARLLAIRSLARLGGAGRVVVAADLEARRECIARAARHVEHWIFPTRSLEAQLRGAGLPIGPSSQLPYGIDETLYGAPHVPSPGGSTRFVYMSQYMPHKGLACLLDAVRLLERRLPESLERWSVELHGNGTGDRHRRYAPAMLRDLPRRVKDCGPFEPLRAPEVLARTDCVVVPSLWLENAPLTILQARAAGVPVIASDVPGVAEVLEHGLHGLLFARAQAPELAAAMSSVLMGELSGVRRDPLVLYADHLRQLLAIYGEQPFELRPQRSARISAGVS